VANAHLVGSMNLRDADEVFQTVGRLAGDSLTRIPDGERGRRAGWIGAQVPVLMQSPQLSHEVHPPQEYGTGEPRIEFRPREGVASEELSLSLPYAEDAIASHRLMRDFIDRGEIPPGTKLQVSIPTAVATLVAFFARDVQSELLEPIEHILGGEVDRIADAIPHDEVAIQWDVAVEFNYIELQRMPGPFTREQLVASLGRLSSLVPNDIELGYHLCYGDAPPELGKGLKGRHFVEPTDAGLLVEFANEIVARATRRVQFIHMPVPIERDDDAYFAPLDGLRLAPQTRLFLGLVHEEDGMAGAQRRVAAARAHVEDFGVGTECGLQNEPPDAIERILAIQRDLELAAPASA
jgi:hypothetical protein